MEVERLQVDVQDGELIAPICRRTPAHPEVVHGACHTELCHLDVWSLSMVGGQNWMNVVSIVGQLVVGLHLQSLSKLKGLGHDFDADFSGLVSIGVMNCSH